MKIVFTKILTQENKHFLGTGAYLFLSDGCRCLIEDSHLQILKNIKRREIAQLSPKTYSSKIVIKIQVSVNQI